MKFVYACSTCELLYVKFVERCEDCGGKLYEIDTRIAPEVPKNEEKNYL